MKVALYCRVSTEEQALNGISLYAQLNELKEYAKEHNYSIVDEYIDDGYSGGLLDRPALNRLLDDIKQDKIELVIFVKLDRWFRSVAHYYKIQEILEQHNVNWLATQEDYETITSSGKFKVNIMLSVSQQFKDATSERIKSAFDYKVRISKEVISGTKIYGYDIVNKHYVINEKEADNIRLLFNKYTECGSINSTYKWWNENIKSELMETTRDRLFNIKYNGKYEYNGKIYNDYIPKIIDDKTFNNVQRLLKSNYKQKPFTSSGENVYILSGLLYCEECGVRFTGSTYKNGYKAYHCSRKERHKCFNNKYITEKKALKTILASLPEKINEYNVSLEQSKKTNKPNLNKLNSKKSKYERIMKAYVNGLIDDDSQILKEAKELKKEIDLLTSQIRDLSKEKPKMKKFDINILSMFNILDDNRKQMVMKNLIERIEVKNGDIISIYPRTE